MTNDTGLAWELFRKLVHLLGLIIVLLYSVLYHFFSAQIAILGLTAVLLLILEFEYIRIEHRPKIISFFDAVFRPHERDHIAGSVFYVISCIICFAAFEYWIAFLAMFMTAFGDMFASLIGKTFGETKLFKQKSLVGTLSGFTINVLIGMIILPEQIYIVSLMALVGSAVELFSNKLDDNLTVPLSAGFIGQVAVYYFGLTLPEVNLNFLNIFF